MSISTLTAVYEGYQMFKQEHNTRTHICAQQVKVLLAQLKEAQRAEQASHTEITKAWKGPLSLFGKRDEARAIQRGVPSWAIACVHKALRLAMESAELCDLADVYGAQLGMVSDDVLLARGVLQESIHTLIERLQNLDERLKMHVPFVVEARAAFEVDQVGVAADPMTTVESATWDDASTDCSVWRGGCVNSQARLRPDGYNIGESGTEHVADLPICIFSNDLHVRWQQWFFPLQEEKAALDNSLEDEARPARWQQWGDKLAEQEAVVQDQEQNDLPMWRQWWKKLTESSGPAPDPVEIPHQGLRGQDSAEDQPASDTCGEKDLRPQDSVEDQSTSDSCDEGCRVQDQSESEDWATW